MLNKTKSIVDPESDLREAFKVNFKFKKFKCDYLIEIKRIYKLERENYLKNHKPCFFMFGFDDEKKRVFRVQFRVLSIKPNKQTRYRTNILFERSRIKNFSLKLNQ